MAGDSKDDKGEWWQSFFTGLVLDVVRRVRPDEVTQAETSFIQRTLNVPPGANILDVPCGSGRHAIKMALRGYRVTGVDIALPLLETAMRDAEEHRLEVTWEHRDMRDLPWKEAFDGAYCFWGSFGYFDEQGNADFLRAVANALKPGAKFVIDTPIAETELPPFQERSWAQFGDVYALEERHYDHAQARVDREWTLLRGGEMEKRSLSMRLYTYRELCLLLQAAGFVGCRGYGSLNHEPFRLGLNRFYMVAVKQQG